MIETVIIIRGDDPAQVEQVAQAILNQRPYLNQLIAGVTANLDALEKKVDDLNNKLNRRTSSDELAEATRSTLLPAVEETVKALDALTPNKQ